MDTSSDEADDWFIDSLNTYKDLHVFQLEHPTKVIEWTGDKRICVAGYTGARSEILELLLPLKLYAGDNQGLCAERDFKVQHGGFSEEPVECLIHIPETRFVVTSGGSSPALQIWDIGGDDSDVIKRTGVINPKSTSAKCGKIASGLTENPTVLHGSYTSDVQLTELATGRVLYTVGNESSDLVSGLQFVNACVFLICTSNGALLMGDIRDPLTCHYPLKESMSGLHWCFGLRTSSSQSDPSLCTIARLSSSGHMVLSDLRDLQNPFCQTQLNVQHSSAKNEFLIVSWASVLDSCLSVSGFDGTVQVYNTRNWSTEAQTPQPVFSHRGHDMSYEAKCSGSRPVVTTHAWHPSRPNTLLSAATDGSVHVWDWVDKTTDT
ncbi:WD repeat-containing protein 73 [Triplophysa rosa]|uniref:WD repeat-containing protein 73 n=1 Tax=Triplophysa rosa TaxID=992332 RepID=A0A9W7WCI2_TRIRA|nr:WD repeat-containing protein 73 [Triplophysa rosa]KAI7796022.1 WD repeat-containing protein 73 [Triplophysa rosa]